MLAACVCFKDTTPLTDAIDKIFQCFLSMYTQYLWPISPMQCFYGPNNIAMRRGQTEKAAALSKKVNQLITERRKQCWLRRQHLTLNSCGHC